VLNEEIFGLEGIENYLTYNGDIVMGGLDSVWQSQTMKPMQELCKKAASMVPDGKTKVVATIERVPVGPNGDIDTSALSPAMQEIHKALLQ
jgi:hypothetical protein